MTGAPALDTVSARPGGRSARIRADVLDATRAELEANGYAALGHRAVARRAGVDPATVYRRWPTRPRLVVDALLEIAGAAVPVPDTGTVAGDFERFLGAVVAVLREPRLLRLFHALSAARADAEEDLAELLRLFWEARFERAGAMVARAVERGELPATADTHQVIEALVAPAYFRALVTGEELGDDFAGRCVSQAIRAAA